MAVVSQPVSANLRIILQTGMDENNKPIYRTKTYSRVKPSTSDEDLMDVAKQLANLQIHPVGGIRRLVETELVEE